MISVRRYSELRCSQFLVLSAESQSSTKAFVPELHAADRLNWTKIVLCIYSENFLKVTLLCLPLSPPPLTQGVTHIFIYFRLILQKWWKKINDKKNEEKKSREKMKQILLLFDLIRD